MNGSDQPSPGETQEQRLARLEARLARVEEYLQIGTGASHEAPVPVSGARGGEEFEFAVGQRWFANVGILALVLGTLFTLSLPYSGLSPFLPPVLGYAAAAAFVLTFARASNNEFVYFQF